MSTRLHGTVARLVLDRGFGFLRDGDGRDVDYFFHHSSLTNATIKQLLLGDPVSFEVSQSDRGLRAEQVTLLRDPFKS
jgi:cold shock CspA family protein